MPYLVSRQEGVKVVGRGQGLGKAEEEMMNGKAEWGYSALVVGG